MSDVKSDPPLNSPEDVMRAAAALGQVPHITHKWVDDSIRQNYEFCVERVREIQDKAQREAEPWMRRAANYYSMGTVPIIMMIPKDQS